MTHASNFYARSSVEKPCRIVNASSCHQIAKRTKCDCVDISVMRNACEFSTTGGIPDSGGMVPTGCCQKPSVCTNCNIRHFSGVEHAHALFEFRETPYPCAAVHA